MAGAVPAMVPPVAAEAARSTLGGAVAAAADLHGPVRDALLEAGREAFTRGFRLASALSALVAAGLAVLVAMMLRAGPARR